jgi:hypothetical protein
MVAIFVFRDGQTCKLPTRQAEKLCKELIARRGQAEMTRLIENGYQEFLAADGESYPISEMTAERVGCASVSA